MRLLIILFAFPFLGFGQELPQVTTQKEPMEFIDAFHPDGCSCGNEAMYPGGNREMQKFIDRYFSSPKHYTLYDFDRSRVYVEFVVNPDGSLSNFDVVKGISDELDQEVLNALKKMPNWIPAGNSCEKFKTLARIPVEIEIL